MPIITNRRPVYVLTACNLTMCLICNWFIYFGLKVRIIVVRCVEVTVLENICCKLGLIFGKRTVFAEANRMFRSLLLRRIGLARGRNRCTLVAPTVSTVSLAKQIVQY